MTTNPSKDLAALVRTVIANAPVWARSDLTSKDSSARERAEEVLAAMIAAAIEAAGLGAV